MPIIDSSYFTGERHIPNLDKPEVDETLTSFIEKYEPRFLNELLGSLLYVDFTAGLKVLPIDARWTNLRNLPSLKNAIANYVYYWYMRNQVTETTGIGEVMNKPENATRVSSANKMVRAWNEMVSNVWDIASYLDTNKATYSNWSWYGSVSSNYWMGYNAGRLRDIFYPINSLNL